ncbi:NF-kappa-B-repressing factor-like [Malaya genurostris]|uniref:NF-kappa-B-repressing factor-like n=1 Tax=Malaya genurostris TaxID=325434 RepID=UPI0026F3ABD1|nr:NF-kappa-B-repressing factor-like [Malaya genurostris]XP_058458838.1 NF-kappa-B-repressing factor-like [Malaya genurostris]XP_058458847.1 NF-kappa-B-repressing factor-like [Malaya genurostris]
MSKQFKRKQSQNTALSTNSNWNIDDYRTIHEPDEHWDLRRTFMLRHQHAIPEDELVCMAQVFVNVELLHCRYPLETMERLKELSEGVANEYRASRRNKLQRTFVSASDAAASKVQRKGPEEQVSHSGSQLRAEYSRKFKPVQDIQTIEDVYNNVVLMNNNYEQTKIEFDKLGTGQMQLVTSRGSSGNVLAQIQIAQFVLAKALCDGEKSAKKDVKELFLNTMAQHCYKIIRKKQSVSLNSQSIERKEVDGTVNHRGQKIVNDFKEQKIDESNLGFKLLQKLGWGGGSLGSRSGGIVDPINCQIKIGRQGLGGGGGSGSGGQTENPTKKQKINPTDQTYEIDINFYKRTMQNFRDSGIEYDLVFSNEFTKEERALFHSMAQRLNLKTRSFGSDKDGSRQFVLLGRKLTPHELLDRILVEKDPIFCEMYYVEAPESDKSDD